MLKRVQSKFLNLQKFSRMQKPITKTRTQVLIGGATLVTAAVLVNSQLNLL